MTQKAPTLTFATGNAQKLLALPVYALGVLATVIVPRTAGHWVVGCGSGIGEGALALYRFASAEAGADADTDADADADADAPADAPADASELARSARANSAQAPTQVMWLARDSREVAIAAAAGIPAVVKSSFRGFWLTLRAQVVVVTHGLGDANRYATRGAFVVQLWHGIPFKRIQLDSQQTTSNSLLPRAQWVRHLLERLYRLASSTISLIPAASELSASRLRTAFGLPDHKVVVTGDPRDDVLCQGTEAVRTDTARSLLFGKLGLDSSSQRVVLYAPTWRDGEVDPGVPSEHEWALIDAWLVSSDSMLVVRPHPHGVGDYAAGIDANARVHLLDSSLQSDINPILPAVDLLITDYSSIALDFALLGRPIAFLAADLEHYAATRGLYEDFATFSGGHHEVSWTALVDFLHQDANTLLTGGVSLEDLTDHANNLAARYHAFRDGRNTERVYTELIHRLESR